MNCTDPAASLHSARCSQASACMCNTAPSKASLHAASAQVPVALPHKKTILFMILIVGFCLISVVCCDVAGANGLASLVLQCLWESFALPVIVNPLVMSLQAAAPRQQPPSKPLLYTMLTQGTAMFLTSSASDN